MKNKLIIFLSLTALMLSSFYFVSCESSYYDDDIYIVRDTVVINVDTLINEQKNTERVKLNLAIQLAAFRNKNYADVFSVKVKESLNTYPEIKSVYSGLYLVTVGNFSDNKKAEEYLVYVKSRGFNNAFIKNFK